MSMIYSRRLATVTLPTLCREALQRACSSSSSSSSSSRCHTPGVASIRALVGETNFQYRSYRSFSSKDDRADDSDGNETVDATTNTAMTTAMTTDTNTTTTTTTTRSSISDEWIPPNRPLAGDQGTSKLYKEHQELQQTEQAFEEALFVIDEAKDSDEDILRKLEEALALEEVLERRQFQQALKEEAEYEKERQAQFSAADNQDDGTSAPVDWLSTRRAALGDDPAASPAVPVLEGQLLTQEELISLLESLGGTETTVLLDDPELPRMGGATGMILCTASNSFHLKNITKSLVAHLKERNLQDLGVLGAQIGSHAYKDATSTWNVVDCDTYMVHVLDASTRTAINLEDLWSGKDPLWRLNFQDDEAMDDYVRKHPVPFSYGPNPEALWDIGKLERSLFAAHNPVIPNLQKQQDRREGKRMRRQLRQEGRPLE